MKEEQPVGNHGSAVSKMIKEHAGQGHEYSGGGSVTDKSLSKDQPKGPSAGNTAPVPDKEKEKGY